MLSIDGGKLAHNEQRVLINNKGSHGIIEKRLKLISKHLKNFKIQVQITVTNKTVKFLEDSVRYLLDAGITLDINIVPVFSKISKYHWDIKSLRLFKKNIYSIAELFLKKYKSGKEFKITNMCCVPGRDLISLAKNNNHSLYFCGLSERHLSISSEGKVYPCFMLSGSKENKPFILGDIWEGMRIPAIFKKKLDYLKSKTSNVISCPANNYFVNGDILRPVSAYSKISKFWIQASKYVNANL